SNMVDMQPSSIPKRVVLRFDVKYEQEEAAINKDFFAFYGSELAQDYYSHLIPHNESYKMHIILNLYSQTSSSIDVHAIEYEVDRVRKAREFTFERLHGAARYLAHLRCRRLGWGYRPTLS
ncbi:hypothetical protein P154DRAFT_438631, partial [Amniculicola lignicola CBS 123094]